MIYAFAGAPFGSSPLDDLKCAVEHLVRCCLASALPSCAMSWLTTYLRSRLATPNVIVGFDWAFELALLSVDGRA